MKNFIIFLILLIPLNASALTRQEAVDFIASKGEADGENLHIPTIDYVIGLLMQYLPNNVKDNIKAQLDAQISAEKAQAVIDIKKTLKSLGESDPYLDQ